MTIRYKYLDDGDEAESTTFAEAVMAVTPGLKIEVDHPYEFAKQIKQLEGDPLILDLRLDQFALKINGEKRQADYRAPALAQEIRSRAAETLKGEYPIVLWSTDKRLKDYERDYTSHDLFDLKVVKNELKDDNRAREVGKQLISLAHGYRTIAQIRDNQTSGKTSRWIHQLLGFDKVEDASFLDTRLLEYFDSSLLIRPVHEYARFLIRHLLKVPGPLIDRKILASRLGVDLAKSPDAEKLMDKHFSSARYTGPFDEGWERWWAFLVETTWEDLVPDSGSLRGLNAAERVSHIKAATRLKGVTPAEPLNSDYSTRFWTICQKLEEPLDPRNGLLLNRDKAYPWQEEQFVSFEAYEQRLVFPRDISPIDRGRLERLKKERSS